MKQVADMTQKEYEKFIFDSGVKDTHGGGRIIKMGADGATEMTARETIATGLGIVIGSVGLTILSSEIGGMMKAEDSKAWKYIIPIVLIGGAIAGGYAGNKLGKKWQESTDKKNLIKIKIPQK